VYALKENEFASLSFDNTKNKTMDLTYSAAHRPLLSVVWLAELETDKRNFRRWTTWQMGHRKKWRGEL